MTVTVRHGNLATATTDITGSVRLPGGDAIPWQLIEQAEKGAAAISGMNVEDPSATASLVGLKEVHVEDTACTEPTIFAGFWEARKIGRAAALRTGAQRQWDASVTDCNALLGDYLITSGIRPAETDIARIYWLLASGYCPLGDAGFIDTASPTSLPAADYTGRTAADVMAECSNLSGKNYFVRWEQDAFWWDLNSPWAPGADSYTALVPSGIKTTPWAFDSVGDHLANGTKRMVLLHFENGGHAISYLRWHNNASSSSWGSPWLDSNGNRTSEYALGPGAPALVSSAFDLNLGICTLDSDPADQGWQLEWSTCYTYSPDYSGPGDNAAGYRFGWLWVHMETGPIDSRDYAYIAVSLWGTNPGPTLCYHEYDWSGDEATIGVSNILSEVDGVTTFAPSSDDPMDRDPSRVYSGCWFEYNGGHVYVPNGTTLAAFRHRDVRASDLNCNSAAAATALATAYLARCESEEDRISVVLHAVPAASVNLARPGQRIPVKFSHIPNYESGAWMTITRRTVAPIVYGLYDLTLDLAIPVLTGYHPAAALAPSLYSQNIGQVIDPATDLATATTGQTVPPTVIGTGDGATVLFALSTAYLSGSVRVWVDGQPVPQASIAETDPAAGSITLDFAPAGASGSATAQTVVASWQIG